MTEQTLYEEFVLKHKTDIVQMREEVKITKIVDEKGNITLKFYNILPNELKMEKHHNSYTVIILDDMKNDPNHHVAKFSVERYTKNKSLENAKLIFIDKKNKKDTFYLGSVSTGKPNPNINKPAKFLFFGNHENNIIRGGEHGNIIYSAGNDNYLYGGAKKDIIYASNGNDKISGKSGDDKIQGFAGDDLIRGDNGADSIWGGTGNDWLMGGRGEDHIEGNEGNDFINGGEDNDFLYGGEGDDLIFGGEGNDLIFGDNNNYDGEYYYNKDEMTRVGFGHDILVGGKGNDTLVGGRGSDFLYGGEGDDNYEFSYGDGANVIAETTQLIERDGKKEYCNAIIFKDYHFQELKVTRHGSHMLITSRKEGDNLSVLVKDQINVEGPKVKWLITKSDDPVNNNQFRISIDDFFSYKSPDLGKITNKEITDMLEIEGEWINDKIASVTNSKMHGKNYDNNLAMLKQIMAATQTESLSASSLILSPSQQYDCLKNVIAPIITQ